MQFTQYGYQCKCGPTTELIKVAYVFDSPVKFTPANSRRFSVVPYCRVLTSPPPTTTIRMQIWKRAVHFHFLFICVYHPPSENHCVLPSRPGVVWYMVINSIPFDSISSSRMAEEINKMKRSRYYSPNFFPFIALIICRVRSPN